MPLTGQGIVARIAGKAILNGVDLRVGQGELLGLIGPNGAGKTTLLKVLANLLPPSEGSVRHGERALAAYPPHELARLVAYLAQDSPVHWSMTVEKVVALGRLPYRRAWGGMTDIDHAAVERAMQAATVTELRHRTADSLSGGERMRVMLARALAVEAETLLVDEPVAMLDPFYQLQIMELLRQVARQGNAVVAVLHDLTLAARFCDRLVLLHRGAVLADGTPGAVLSDANLAAAYHVSTFRGRHAGEDFIVPWGREEPKG